MANMILAGLFDPIWKDGWLFWYQIPLLILLVGIIVGYLMWRKKQM